MAKTRQLRKRIKAVANIRRITKTMQMIATAKFSAALQRATASKPYTEALFELVTDLARNVGEVSHPLFGGSSGRRGNAPILTLVLTSDRGLCGPYNGSVLRTAMQFLRANPAAKSGLVELVGKKGAAFLKFNNVPVAQQHQIGDKPTYEAVEAIANQYMERFASGQVGAVHVVYMRFISAGRQVPTTLQLLPFSAEAAAQLGRARTAAGTPGDDPAHATANYEFSPSPAELLGDLLPAAVKAVLFQAFNDAVVSEHVARMVAMKAATDNAGKAGKNLTRVFNRARQAQITTELTEIISGAAALN
ncbi:MAG: ATP synthase F1 subunit gamma [Phycisphaeraceae bacterium]|nr:MAG: ATP synthase F1 subunit gamma [Phycisphaeraceae bacterium]